jgi:uncharacterized protein (DUF427 family)
MSAAAIAPDQVTKSRETIHNPQDARHFMRVKPVPGRVRILLEGEVVADSERALRVLEAGRDIYDPVLYIPRADVRAQLIPIDRKTHCPIKGDCSYYDVRTADGATRAAELAWCYHDVLDFAAALKDLIAFDRSRVVIEEHPPRRPS